MKEIFYNQLYTFVMIIVGAIGIYYAFHIYVKPDVMSASEFSRVQPGGEVNFIAMIASMDIATTDTQASFRYTVEIAEGKREPRLTGVRVILVRDKETGLSLGHEDDIYYGAFLKVIGTKTQDGQVLAKDISVISNYVQSPPETVPYDTYPEAGYSVPASSENADSAFDP